jgi:putative transposase
MKKSRFSEQQIAFILKQAEDGTTVEEVCCKAGSRSKRTTDGAASMAD